jgi:hypothetical protein
MRRALRLALAAMLGMGLAVSTGSTAALAAACPALDYQAALASAATVLQQNPPDLTAAQRLINTLLAANPGSRDVLQPVTADLDAAPPNIADAELRLSSMSATLAYPRGSVCNENAAAARGALHDVYAAPEFRHLDDPVQQSPIAGILDAIGNLLDRGAGALGPAGAVLLTVAVLGVSLALAWRRWHGSAALRGAAVDEPAAPGDDPDAEWQAAERAAAAGDYREAVRRAFRSALVEVAVRGRVRIDAAWTTRELLRRIDAPGDVLVGLAAAAAVFERAWYSGVAVTADDWTRATERCAAVRRLAREAGAAAR